MFKSAMYVMSIKISILIKFMIRYEIIVSHKMTDNIVSYMSRVSDRYLNLRNIFSK